MTETGRTAIVTGAGKRIGRAIAASLAEQGWTVVAHVRRDSDEVPAPMGKIVADLADLDCAGRIFGAAEGLPPIRLLVNNAARFAKDDFDGFDAAEFDAHMAVNVRAPILLMQELARRHDGADALVVNLLDSKLSAPNADFLSYTLSKQALAGATELAARTFASSGIRVNGIAPSLVLRSAGQSEENFARMHAHNPLGKGVVAGDIAAAISYLVDATAVTGQVLTIDGGQRFYALERDVQFLDPR